MRALVDGPVDLARSAPGGRCGGAPHCAGGSRRSGSEMRGPFTLEAVDGDGVVKRSPVADHGPERYDADETHVPWTRADDAALRAGRNARPAVPARGPPTAELTRESDMPAEPPRFANEGSRTPVVVAGRDGWALL